MYLQSVYAKLGWQGISEPGEIHAMTVTLRKMTMSKKYADKNFHIFLLILSYICLLVFVK